VTEWRHGNVKNKLAIVAGASGIAGRGLVEHLTNLDDWDIIGLARKAHDDGSRVRLLPVDLLDLRDRG
jgi:hypothetical protein